MLDVVIVGGGPAGLSAALVLGRCRRRLILCDAGRPRNHASPGVHMFLSRDGIPPHELRRIGLEQLRPYGVEVLEATVMDARRDRDTFVAVLADGRELRAKALLLATGLIDCLPPVPGIERFYGRGVFHCPYCDGWEARDQPLAAYGRGGRAAEEAVVLTTWSRDVALYTDGPAMLRRPERARLVRLGIEVRETRIARLEGDDGGLAAVAFADGTTRPCRALFFKTAREQRSELAQRLGCRFDRKGSVQTSRKQGTRVPGLYVAGDAAVDMQMAVVAAAEGAKAGAAIDMFLRRLDVEAALCAAAGRAA